MIRALRQTWPAFREDLSASGRALRSYPLVPAISVAFALTALVPEPWLWLLLPAAVFALGWPGTERMLFLRAYRGLPLLRAELVPFTRAFMGRFLALGLVAAIALTGVGIVYAVSSDPDVRRLALALALLGLDIFLTFVGPALAYSTRRVTIAVRLGHRLLVRSWPSAVWYAFAPPLAGLVLLRLLPSAAPAGWTRTAIVASGALATLWLRGAVAAFYLRAHPATDDGAVHASVFETLDPATGEPRRPEI